MSCIVKASKSETKIIPENPSVERGTLFEGLIYRIIIFFVNEFTVWNKSLNSVMV
jgi:hypothetical protein